MSADRVVGALTLAAGIAVLATDNTIDGAALLAVIAACVMALFSVAVLGAFAFVAWELLLCPARDALLRLFSKGSIHVRR